MRARVRGCTGKITGICAATSAERVEDPLQRGLVVDVGRRVQRDERVRLRAGAVHQPEHLQNRVRLRAAAAACVSVSIMTLPTREIDDGPVPSASRFSSASAEGVKCQRRQPIGDDAVDLLGHAAIVASAAPPRRGRPECRASTAASVAAIVEFDVAVDERRVGPAIVEAALHADEDLGGLLRVRA